MRRIDKSHRSKASQLIKYRLTRLCPHGNDKYQTPSRRRVTYKRQLQQKFNSLTTNRISLRARACVRARIGARARANRNPCSPHVPLGGGTHRRASLIRRKAGLQGYWRCALKLLTDGRREANRGYLFSNVTAGVFMHAVAPKINSVKISAPLCR